MKTVKITALYFIVFVSCSSKTDSVEKISTLFQFPKKLKEVSGITYSDELIWTVQDSGNTNEIFGLDLKGNIIKQITVDNAKNIDWEELTSDKNGNIYIGDFGNNDNDRQDLGIYKLDSTDFSKISQKINFYYPEQTDFPPNKKELLYDCEAFFFFKNSFYLFTKNRSKGFDGTTLIYKVPATAGNHEAQLIGKFQTCSTYNSCVITAAAISPDEKKVVILSHEKIWLFEDFKDDDFVSGTISELNLNHFSQKEAISFKDNETLFIADEKTKKIGGMLYTTSINKLKSSH